MNRINKIETLMEVIVLSSFQLRGAETLSKWALSGLAIPVVSEV